MTAELQIALWGAATCGPVLLNTATKRSADALGLSSMILLTWVMGRVLNALYTPPESMSLYPVIDMLAGATVFSAWATRPRWWKLALVALFTAQCALHAAFWLAWPSPGSLVRYLWVNNSLFALQLICVGAPGGGQLARDTLAWMSRSPWARHHARV